MDKVAVEFFFPASLRANQIGNGDVTSQQTTSSPFAILVVDPGFFRGRRPRLSPGVKKTSI